MSQVQRGGRMGVDFIRDQVFADLKANRTSGRVHTRFPPEPNGYLHLGHAKAMCLDFGVAAEHGGACNLRFDDTNPETEDAEFVRAIMDDIRWLGFEWDGQERYASDYFPQLYEAAEGLIRRGAAYVDSLSGDEIRARRGTLTTSGVDSPYRVRAPEDNLALFRRMRAGECPDGAHVLRAKIDMASPNLNLRDPVLYRIRKAPHHRTGDAWSIYPMYDFAHPLSDAYEGITHSLATLEYEDHRPLYDWVIRECQPLHRPQQLEFARLNVSHTVMSKRVLRQLVSEHAVSGWDDPRMPTLSGLRRRGYTPESIHAFCAQVGVAKKEALVDVAALEHAVRDDLNRRARRAMVVVHPIRVVILNYPRDLVEMMSVPNNPEEPAAGARLVSFSRELFIERDDFMESPTKQFFRLAPGREVRLRSAYLITCQELVKDAQGDVAEVRCTYDPASRGGTAADGRSVKATLHWVSSTHAVPAEVRLYDRLFTVADPVSEASASGRALLEFVNPHSVVRVQGCRLEPGLAHATPGERFQFERVGYFIVDADSRPGALVFNRTVTLKDRWARLKARAVSGDTVGAAELP